VQVIHMAHERLADWLAGFERSIRLEGNLGDEECAQLMQAANMCPVGRTLGLSADIRTNDNVSVGRAG
jgi:putative redox protein